MLVSDPWAELIQSGCQNQEADLLQPPLSFSPRSHLRWLRSLWAISPQTKPKHLFRNSHPIAMALDFLLAKEKAFPLITTPPLLPLFELCQLAFLWDLAGEKEAALSLAQKLLPLISFPSLFCPEAVYDEREALWSFSLFARAFGKKEPYPIPPNPDPYFLALAQQSPVWEEGAASMDWSSWGIMHHRTPLMDAVVTLAGNRTLLGALSMRGVEVRAFGPQAYPLNDPKNFGIVRIPDEEPMERWTSVAALPEIWFEVKSSSNPFQVETSFYGLTPETPLAFAFYLKADRAVVGIEKFQPKSLRRYSGKAQRAIFGKGEGELAIESALPGKMELIPLAGSGCFWDADFLLSFSIHPFEAQAAFFIKNGNSYRGESWDNS